ncbi:MAG: DNA polymerase III subunit gamma/tau [Firmicutes bacterium]|nr:DNA polymerase III subunit gamma/tau [Bacillota bacterium]
MYTALYRKKRPKDFGSVIGQKAIVATLKNQLSMQRISHAYLFSGTRGTGKTSTAKIFARALNCPQSQELGEPCNVCETCQDILAERSLNVIEIDAASNNGVDNIRELREEVKYPPSSGTHKVYIIDEAHMLTVAAFNALLKTLEEPPQHVIFILATTDPQKLPATILSRCQRYDFKRISKIDMVETLLDYMKADNVAIETPALEYIASVSDGAMRDALSILDQCLSLYINAENTTITLQQVQNLLGAVDQASLFAYTNALFNKDTQAALEIIAKAFTEGRDLSRMISDIIQHLRNILVASQITTSDILDCSAETLQLYKNQAQNPLQLISYIKEFSEFQNQLRFLPQERLALEVCTIKLTSNIQEIQNIQKPQTVQTVQKPQNIPNVQTAQTVATSPTTTAGNDWQTFCNQLTDTASKVMLKKCTFEIKENYAYIYVESEERIQTLQMRKDFIKPSLLEYYNLPQETAIVFTVQNVYNNTTINENTENNEITINDLKTDLTQKIKMPITYEK